MSMSIYTMPDMPENEAERGRAVVRSGALTAINSAALCGIVAEARRQLGTAMALVTIIYQDSAYVVAASGFMPGIYRRSTSFCGHAILTPAEPFVIPDASTDERFAGNPLVEGGDGVRFYAAVALTDEEALPIGTLCVLDPCPRPKLKADETRCLRLLSAAAMEYLRTAEGSARTPR